MKVGIYCRVSTDSQDTQAQEHAIAEWLKVRNPSAVLRFQDLGISGSVDERPGLLAMQAAIARGEVDTVVTFRLDRISRRAVTALRLLLDWLHGGIAFYAVDTPILYLGHDNPMRLTVAAMFAEVSEIERQAIVSRVKSGLAAAKAKGVRLGAAPKLSQQQRSEIRALAKAGNTYRSIAPQFGVTAATVCRVCKE